MSGDFLHLSYRFCALSRGTRFALRLYARDPHGPGADVQRNAVTRRHSPGRGSLVTAAPRVWLSILFLESPRRRELERARSTNATHLGQNRLCAVREGVVRRAMRRRFQPGGSRECGQGAPTLGRDRVMPIHRSCYARWSDGSPRCAVVASALSDSPSCKPRR